MEGITSSPIFLLGDSSLLTATAPLALSASLDAAPVRLAGGVVSVYLSAVVTAESGRDRFGTAALSADVSVTAGARGTTQANASLSAESSVGTITTDFDVYRLVTGSASGSSVASIPAVAGEPVIRLILPTTRVAGPRHRLFGRINWRGGVAMLVNGGVVTMTSSPSDTDCKAADFFFLGGYRHQITEAQRDVIVAAGYGDLIEEA